MDYIHPNATTPVAYKDKLIITEAEKEINLSTKMSNLAKEHAFVVIDLVTTRETENSSSILEMRLRAMSAENTKFSELEELYTAIKLYLLGTALTVESATGDSLFFITGSVEYGNTIAWISPIMEQAFVEQEGPVQK